MKKEKETTKRFFSWVAVISIFWIIIAFAPQEPKIYKLELTYNQWVAKSNELEYIKNQLKRSDLPSRDVVFMCDSIITKFQIEIGEQVGKQLSAEKQITDSLNKTPKKNQP